MTLPMISSSLGCLMAVGDFRPKNRPPKIGPSILPSSKMLKQLYESYPVYPKWFIVTPKKGTRTSTFNLQNNGGLLMDSLILYWFMSKIFSVLCLKSRKPWGCSPKNVVAFQPERKTSELKWIIFPRRGWNKENCFKAPRSCSIKLYKTHIYGYLIW